VLELVSVFVPRLELFQARECDGNRDEGSNVSRARKIEGAVSASLQCKACVKRGNQGHKSVGRKRSI